MISAIVCEPQGMGTLLLIRLSASQFAAVSRRSDGDNGGFFRAKIHGCLN